MTKEALDTAKDAHGAVFRDILPAGHRCGPVNCTEEQWDALTKAGEMEKAARAKLMPTERTPLRPEALASTIATMKAIGRPVAGG
jgi:hypothetical protein